MDDHFNVKFSSDGKEYEAQVWPDTDMDNRLFCQVTYHATGHPENSKIIYLEFVSGAWRQKIVEDGEAMASPEFIAALGEQAGSSPVLNLKIS
jgi:hypothetical protein